MDAKTPVQNRILQKLPPDYLNAIMPSLELMDLEPPAPVIEPNQPIEYVYFPDSGIISLVTPMEDGSAVEAATIGNEGMVGIPLILGAKSCPTKAFCQIAGRFWRMRATDFDKYFLKDPTFLRLMLRYTQTLFDLVAQTSACNRLHTIEERCARWLLLLHDRAGSGDTFLLTQEFLAQMLGVQRSGVNLAAGMLQKANLITYVRGRVTITDRKGLEAISCECYRVVRNAFDKLEAAE